MLAPSPPRIPELERERLRERDWGRCRERPRPGGAPLARVRLRDLPFAVPSREARLIWELERFSGCRSK